MWQYSTKTIYITNVIQNNTGMYTKESSQQTFRIPNNNLDVRFELANPKPQQWNSTDQKVEQDKPQFMMVKFQNVMFLMHRTRFDQYISIQIVFNSNSNQLWCNFEYAAKIFIYIWATTSSYTCQTSWTLLVLINLPDKWSLVSVGICKAKWTKIYQSSIKCSFVWIK